MLAVGSGLLYGLAQPGFGVWPLVFVCLTPLLAALRGAGPGRRAVLGWLMGTVGAAITIGPTVFAAGSTYFEFGTAGSFGLVAAISQIFAAVPVALFTLIVGDPQRQSTSSWILRVALAWVVSEFARATAFTGLPWTFLPHALVPVPEFLQVARYGGAPLVSLWIASVSAALCAAWLTRSRGALIWALGSIVAVGLSGMTVIAGPDEGTPSIRVRLVQPALPAEWRSDARATIDALDRLVQLSIDPGPIDLIVWPENASGVVVPANSELIQRFTDRLRGVADAIVFGAPRIAGGDRPRLHNSALVIAPDGTLLGAHDKVRLVPFAEYVPDWAAARGWSGPRYTAGTTPAVIAVGNTSLGILICYEVLFAGLSRSLVDGGGEVIVNLSNDDWLGGSAGREQHLAAAVLRAVEFGRPIVRATNSGATAHIDRFGRVRARLKAGVPGAVDVIAHPTSQRTLFARTGDVVSPLATLAIALGQALGLVRRQRSPNLRAR